MRVSRRDSRILCSSLHCSWTRGGVHRGESLALESRRNGKEDTEAYRRGSTWDDYHSWTVVLSRSPREQRDFSKLPSRDAASNLSLEFWLLLRRCAHPAPYSVSSCPFVSLSFLVVSPYLGSSRFYFPIPSVHKLLIRIAVTIAARITD